MSKVFHRVKVNKLVVPAEDLNSSDPSSQRQAPYRFLKDILERIDNVVKAEVEKSKPLMAQIATAFQLDEDELLEEDMIDELVADVSRFYNEVNNNQVNIQIIPIEPVKKAVKQIVKAYKDIQSISDSDDMLSILMAFSGDPIASLMVLTTLLTKVDEGIEKANNQIAFRLSQFGDSTLDADETNPYVDSLNAIDKAKALWEGGNDDEH